MKANNYRNLLMMSAVFYMIAATSAVGAQTDDRAEKPQTVSASKKDEFDDIVVTARRSEETLQNVPVAVTALNAETLERYSSSSLDKIVQQAPQVILARGFSGSGASIVIRGIGSSTGDPGLEQSVAINVDGIQIGRGRIASAAMFDLKQVEILKGPQALFFGKNSPAGVISLISAGPGNEMSGYIKGGYELVADEKYAEAAIGGPITGTLGARLAIRASKMAGYLDNVARPIANPAAAFAAFPYPGATFKQTPNATSVTGRFSLAWKPDPNFDATIKTVYDVYSDHDFSGAAQTFCAPGVASTNGGFLDVQDDCKFNSTVAATSPPSGYLPGFPGARSSPYANSKSSVSSIAVNYRSGPISLSSISGYFSLDNKGFNNAATSGISVLYNSSPETVRQVTQEFRISSDLGSQMNFTAGAFYEYQDRVDTTAFRAGNFPADPATGLFYNYERRSKNSSNTYSGYGQIRWKFIDRVELTAGARYTKDKKSNVFSNNFVDRTFLGIGFRPAGSKLLSGFKDNNWSPEVTLTWIPSPNLTTYAAYKTGYKSGGFSNPSLTNAVRSSDITFGSETAKGGEVGLKWRMPDEGLRGDLTVYQYTYNGLQVASFNAATTSLFIRNAARTRAKGVELSVNWQATTEFSLRAAGGYNKARYLSFPNAPCYARQTSGCSVSAPRVQDLAGAPLLRAPDWSLTMGISYDVPLSQRFMAGLTFDANYSSRYSTLDNNDPIAYQAEFWRINASARLYTNDDDWELALIGRNLANQLYKVATIDRPGGTPGQYVTLTPRGREASLQITKRF